MKDKAKQLLKGKYLKFYKYSKLGYTESARNKMFEIHGVIDTILELELMDIIELEQIRLQAEKEVQCTK